MKHLLIAATLGLALAAFAAPTATAAPAKSTAQPAAVASPGAQLPPECIDKLKKHAEKMKKELGLTDAQAASIRSENERFRAQLMASRDAHRAAVDKILTPEQRAKADAKRDEHKNRRKARMERKMDGCKADLDDDELDDDDNDDHQKGKPKK